MTAILIAAAVFLGPAALAVLAMRRHPDLHLWPSLHRCRLCGRRVFAWQAREFRDYDVRVDNPDRLPNDRLPRVSGSGLVHAACAGVPAVSFTVRRRTMLN